MDPIRLIVIVLVVLVVLLLVGGLGQWGGGPYLGLGWRGGAPLGLIVLVLLILLLAGRI